MVFSVTENIREQEEVFSPLMLLQSRDWEAKCNLEEAKGLGNLGREMQSKRREKAAVGTTLRCEKHGSL